VINYSLKSFAHFETHIIEHVDYLLVILFSPIAFSTQSLPYGMQFFSKIIDISHFFEIVQPVNYLSF